MDIGHLNIPKYGMKNVSFLDHDIRTQLYLQYSKLLKNSGFGSKILQSLENDQRVTTLKDQTIMSGKGATRFEIEILAMWYLWAINEFGHDIAEINLNRFLNSETIPMINTLWVLGIEIDETIELANGLKIISIYDMPDSREKEQYIKRDLMTPHRLSIPKAAITFEGKAHKSCKYDNLANMFEIDNEFWKSSDKMYELSLLLNVLEGVSCTPHFSTSYTLPEMPLEMFGISAGDSPLFDIISNRTTKLPANCTDKINGLITAFNNLTNNNKIRFTRVLTRLSQSKRRDQIEDKILDLGIALEMALLEDNKNNNQLSLSFRLRGSWLIASNYDERQIIYKNLSEIYDYRSQVAHSGTLCGNDKTKIDTVRKKFQEYSRLAEKIIQHLHCCPVNFHNKTI